MAPGQAKARMRLQTIAPANSRVTPLSGLWYVNVILFIYYVLHVFLIRQAFLDFFAARENPARRANVEKADA